MKTFRVIQFHLCATIVFGLGLASPWNAGAQSPPTNSVVPVVQIFATDASASESGDTGTFTILRDGSTNDSLLLFFAISGTASNGVDYHAFPSYTILPAGVRTLIWMVVPIDDTLVEGPETVTLTLTYPPLGGPGTPPINYSIGRSNTATVVITDNDPPPTNLPPTVRLVAPTNGAAFDPPANIVLAAEGKDTDGYVATVEFFSGTISLGIRTNNPISVPPANPFTLVWSNVPPGQYVLKAKATDDDGAVAWSDPVAVGVKTPLLPVVTVVATDPNASEPGLTANVDPGMFTVYRSAGTNTSLPVFCSIGGTASNGVDYAAISNVVVIPQGAWSANIIIQPLGDTIVEGMERVVLHVLASACPGGWPPPPECYTVGTPAEATVFIADFAPLTNLPPTVQIRTPTNHSVFTAPIDLSIVAEAKDSDDLVAKVEFFAGTNRLGFGTNLLAANSSTNLYLLVWSNAPLGSHVMTVKATDNRGASAVSAPVEIAVRQVSPPTNLPPVVKIVSPASGATYTAPVNVSLYASASDSDGTVASVEFFAGTNSLGFGKGGFAAGTSSNIFYLVWSNVPPGQYSVKAKATDNIGATAWSEPIQITVNSTPTPQPVVTIRATDPYAGEPCGGSAIDPGKFTVYRSLGTNIALLVRYTISGTASNGIDYVAISNAVVLPKGAWSADIVVTPLPDTLLEGTETVVLHVMPPICPTTWPPPPECYLVGQPAEAAVYIRDCAPTNRPPLVQITKPANGASFRAPATIGIVADTVDSDGYVGKVEFFAGNTKIGEQTKLFLVPPPPGQHIAYELMWSNVPAGKYALTAKATDDLGATAASTPVQINVVTNVPPPFTNWPPVVTICATDPLAIEGTNCWGWPGTWSNSATPPTWSTNCGPKNATLAVYRDGDTNGDLIVTYWIGGTATNGVDYDALPGVVTLPAGVRKANILIVPIEDQRPDPPRTVILKLVPPANAPPPYLVGRSASAAALIVDSTRPRPVTSALTDRCFHLRTDADDGAWFRIDYSTDMANWETITTGQVIQGALHFVDPEAPGSVNRFYRAIPVPDPNAATAAPAAMNDLPSAMPLPAQVQ